MQVPPPKNKKISAAAAAGAADPGEVGGGPLNPGWRYHLLGVGGMGMSALAEVMHRRGFSVTGSDAEPSGVLERLRGLGIPVATGHAPHLLDGMDAVIYSPALGPGHPVWEAVTARGLPRFSRSQALAALLAPFRTLAVTGTHGKTTCSAALAQVLVTAGWDPTVLVGGQVPQLDGGNARNGGSDWAVVEADESDGGFTLLAPRAVLLTNIEAEHLDHHGSMAAVRASFGAFLQRLQPEGVLVYCRDAPQAAEMARGFAGRAVSYGTSPHAQVRVASQTLRGGETAVTLSGAGRSEQFRTRLFGAHNALNLAGVYALAREVGVPAPAVVAGLQGFRGVARRQQFLGELGGCRVFDDYAHHPTEVRATLTAFLEKFGEPLTVVFQPHLFSRTRFFAGEFADALRPATQVFVTDIYGAREQPLAGVDSGLILAGLQHHPGAFLLPDWRDAARWQALPEGTLVTMGAGDIAGLGPLLLGGAKRP